MFLVSSSYCCRRPAALQNIQDKVMATVQGAAVISRVVDAQWSVQEGVLLQVSGSLRLKVRELGVDVRWPALGGEGRCGMGARVWLELGT